MRHADQVTYIERLLAMARTNTRDDAPGLSHAPVREYFDPARYDDEVGLLFRRYPVVVAFPSQLRKPGDFVTHTDTGQPILVVRGTDGPARLLNVCRHRSVEPGRGAGKRVRLSLSRLDLRSDGRLPAFPTARHSAIDREPRLRGLAVAGEYGLSGWSRLRWRPATTLRPTSTPISAR